MSDLFNLDRALTPDERRRLKEKPKKTGHAAPPGSGPTGETCKTCRHIFRNQQSKTYIKCGLIKWTHGAGTDIRARDPACSRWEPTP